MRSMRMTGSGNEGSRMDDRMSRKGEQRQGPQGVLGIAARRKKDNPLSYP